MHSNQWKISLRREKTHKNASSQGICIARRLYVALFTKVGGRDLFSFINEREHKKTVSNSCQTKEPKLCNKDP